VNLDDVKALVRKGESERVEFKRSTGQRTAAAKTVCAMLNGLGGFVIFGVTDRDDIIGQQVSTRTLEGLASELRRIEPPAFPDIETIPLKENRSVIVISSPGGGGPYTFDGRLESTTRRDTESILCGLELIHEDKLLNAAVALYGKSDRLKPLYPQLEIRLARFRGKNRLADFADNRQYWGHAFSLLRRAESFLIDHVPIAGRVIPGKMVREDQPLYPPRATREAIANAICHRDYTIPGGAVAVAMYDDHLEITNPGTFHFGITPEKLTRPHESKPWNPIIANVFYRAGIIERWGTGTLNIIDWCKENGNPPPTWQEQAGSVYVTFQPSFPPEHQVGTKLGLSWDQVEIMRNCLKDKAITELMAVVGRSNRTKFRDQVLKPLIDDGLIEMTIPDKPRSSKQRYRLTENGRRILREIRGGKDEE